MKKRILFLSVCLILFLSIFTGFLVSTPDKNDDDNRTYHIAGTGGKNSLEQMCVSTEQINADVVKCNDVLTKATGIEELKGMFPDGRYWNHEGNPSDTSPYSVTFNPCHSTYYDTSCCNVFEGGAQCHGYALFLSYLYNGGSVSTYKYGITHNISELQVGDVVRYRIPNSGYDHSIFVTGINGNTVYYSDCNYDLHCRIRWNLQISKSELANLMNGTLNSTYDFPGQYSKTGFILSYSKRTISYDISECSISVSDVNRYKGETKPTIIVKHEGKELVYNVDYDCYFSNKNEHSGYVTIRGQGKYEGEVIREYSIVREDFTKCQVINFKSQYEYTGNNIKPEIKLVDQHGRELSSDEYYIIYEISSIIPGKYKLEIRPSHSCDIYEGELSIDYEIIKKDITGCTVKYEDTVKFVGVPVSPKVEVYDEDRKLIKGYDYEVGYKNNAQKGLGEIVIKGIGKFYDNEVTKSFNITVDEKEIIAH